MFFLFFIIIFILRIFFGGFCFQLLLKCHIHLPFSPPACCLDYSVFYAGCWSSPCCGHECMQQEGLDFAEQCLCNQWPGAAGSGSEHRLLALPGGGSHYASEPEH